MYMVARFFIDLSLDIPILFEHLWLGKNTQLLAQQKNTKKHIHLMWSGGGVNMEPPLVIGSFHHVNHEKE